MNVGMCARDVLVEIVESNKTIKSVPFHFYVAFKTLNEESAEVRSSINRMINDNPTERPLRLQRSQVFSKLETIISDLVEPENLAVESKVRLFNGGNSHIPMMDFDCEISEYNLERIKTFLAKIGQRGVILESGRSYQYYGLKLMSEKELLRKFLGPCLLFTGYTDCRYIGHRIVAGSLSLRVSNGGLRPRIPTVVSFVP